MPSTGTAVSYGSFIHNFVRNFHTVFHSGCINVEFIFVYTIREQSNFILLHVAVQFSQHHLLKRLSSLHCIFLPPLSKIRCPQVHGFISRLSILFQWSIFLFLYWYPTVLITAALQYSLKSRRLIPPVLFFFLKIALGIQGLKCFHMNCEIFLVLVL